MGVLKLKVLCYSKWSGVLLCCAGSCPLTSDCSLVPSSMITVNFEPSLREPFTREDFNCQFQMIQFDRTNIWLWNIFSLFIIRFIFLSSTSAISASHEEWMWSWKYGRITVTFNLFSQSTKRSLVTSLSTARQCNGCVSDLHVTYLLNSLIMSNTPIV